MAIESPRVRADVVEVSEFPDLITRYAVRGVPKTIVNDQLFIEGAVPESELLAALTQATAAAAPEGSP